MIETARTRPLGSPPGRRAVRWPHRAARTPSPRAGPDTRTRTRAQPQSHTVHRRQRCIPLVDRTRGKLITAFWFLF
eukprot:scaffold28770_cov64-Phaeocystis_antarctica.AAC.5